MPRFVVVGFSFLSDAVLKHTLKVMSKRTNPILFYRNGDKNWPEFKNMFHSFSFNAVKL